MAVSENELVQPARQQYNDFKGSAAADTELTFHGELHDRMGLNEDRYWIVGIEKYGTDFDSDGLTVLAIDKESTGISNWEELQAHHAEHGEVPVTDFRVHDIPAAELLDLAFSRFSFQLLSRSLPVDANLRITLRDDLNYSGD